MQRLGRLPPRYMWLWGLCPVTGWLTFEHRPTWIGMFAAVDQTSMADQSSGSIPLVDHSSFSLLFCACQVQSE